MKTTKIKLHSILKRVYLALLIFILSVVTGYTQPEEEWVARVNKFDKDEIVTSMTTDKDGFVYLTGYTEGKNSGKDFLTVKFSQKGEELWSAIFKGQGNAEGQDDIARSIAVDDNGNVYVTGSAHGGVRGRDIVTIKYDADGNEKFINHFSGMGAIEDSDDEAIAIGLDGEGSVIVAGNSEKDICLIKYKDTGATVWAQTFDGGFGSDDYVKDIKIDHEGNIVIGAVTTGINSAKDYFTAKYSKEGDKMWNVRYNGVGGNIALNDDELNALDIDNFGNIYVTGYSYGPSGKKDFLTVMYDDKGNEIWVSRTLLTQSEPVYVNNSEATDLKVDKEGNVYLTGRTYNQVSGNDFLTVKLNGKGETLWRSVFSNSYLGFVNHEQAIKIETDAFGNVYVAGSSLNFDGDNKCGNMNDFTTIKYSNAGEKLWVKRYSGPGLTELSNDIVESIVIDNKGGIIVAGASMGYNTEMDFCVIRYTENNNFEKNRSVKKLEKNVRLYDNFPNPFNPTTMISFDLPEQSKVRLSVYDITGREVSKLVNTELNTGKHEYQWDATQFASGTYFYRLNVNGSIETKRMSLIK